MAHATVDSWSGLEISDLFYAYRKAKSDCFFERSLFVAEKFVKFEENLSRNLSNLLHRLKTQDPEALLREYIGEPKISAKKLGLGKKKPSQAGALHGFFSDPRAAFKNLCSTQVELVPEFRLIGDFQVEMHVLSALWINLVGHKFDAVLSKNSYGSRLRRYRAEPGSPKGTVGKYHIESIGSFSPYFDPYRQWRENGLGSIRTELEADRAVIALTMDLTSYYHRIDPSFLGDEAFHRYAGIKLSEWEYNFTSIFSSALVAWSTLAREKLVSMGVNSNKVQVGGLPIGLSISRVAANALLVGLDREIEEQLNPVYYGRYVDDLFIVLRDPGCIDSPVGLIQFIAERTKCFPKRIANKEISLRLPENYGGKTTLVLQPAKQKLFFLSGQGGLDLLNSIESQIRSVSSERRLMPSPDNLESMAAAKVLTAAGQAAEEADTLRRADGLSVRRLGWAVLLRAVETLARDLRQDDWKKERAQFYDFALNHILRPDKIFDHLDYLPRLLSLAVAMMDWPNARRLYDAALESVRELEEATSTFSAKVNGYTARAGRSHWDEVRSAVSRSAADAIVRSIRWGQRNGGPRPLSETALKLCREVGLGDDESAIHEVSCQVRECDWAKISYKDHIRRDAIRERPRIIDEELLHGLYEHHDDLCEFLQRSINSAGLSTSRVHPRCSAQDKRHNQSLLPYLFPTRPYSTQEVSLFLPQECIFTPSLNNRREAAKKWARYIRAVRGVWVWDSLVQEESAGQVDNPAAKEETSNLSVRYAILDSADKGKRIRLGISSIQTTDQSWVAGASGRPDISRDRYERIKRLIDQAVTAYPRPTHLLLPELSLPVRWIDTVCGLLRQSGISLVAGLDYHCTGDKVIHSEALLVLSDDRLGFPAYVQIHQPKTLPAPGEEERLYRHFGRTWKQFEDTTKPIYIHRGFSFGVLVCSELQNVEHRLRFQGEVDSVMVLAWNQDLETFSALVESASLDVHAYVALVNNRDYGDSRVRVPAKEHYGRDLCRVRGGENEQVVVVKIDYELLRQFQSRNKRWPQADDPFKPCPEGFQIKEHRKMTPC